MKKILNKAKKTLCVILSALSVVAVASCGQKSAEPKVIESVKNDGVPVHIQKAANNYFKENRNTFVEAYVKAYFGEDNEWAENAACSYFKYKDEEKSITAKELFEKLLLDNSKLFTFEVAGVSEKASDNTYTVVLKSVNYKAIFSDKINPPANKSRFQPNKGTNCYGDRWEHYGAEAVYNPDEDMKKFRDKLAWNEAFTEEDVREFYINLYILDYIYETINDNGSIVDDYIVGYKPNNELTLEFIQNENKEWVCKTTPIEFAEQVSNVFYNEV